MAGPSKAGKSFALIELCCAIAEGRKWLQWDCTRGKVMYVNLELDRASCLHRFKDVYNALGWSPDNLSNIDIWNLRGKSVPMDKLAPKLIRRAQKKNYIAIVIDPIYKVITGDENSADQMAHFCNQFDRVCTDLGAAVIYCHHHSKGSQGSKRSMDRASGSGVFARDPDVLIDLIELELSEAVIKNEENKATCKVCIAALEKLSESYLDDRVSQDDVCSAKVMTEHCETALNSEQFAELKKQIRKAKDDVNNRSAWRIEGTLREFPKFQPVNLWFDYPTHNVDTIGVLKDVEPEGERAPWQKAIEKRKNPEVKKEARHNEVEIAFASLEMEGKQITVEDLADEMGVTKRTVWRRIKEHGGLKVEKTETGKESYVSRH
jgi:RecA-family ATPase